MRSNNSPQVVVAHHVLHEPTCAKHKSLVLGGLYIMRYVRVSSSFASVVDDRKHIGYAHS